MRTESFACFLDRFDQRVAEFFVPKMFAHPLRQSLPKCFAALFMDSFIANDRELMGTRRHENQNGIAFPRFVHSKPMEFSLGRDEWIDIYLAALNVNANLAGSFRFGVADRLHDPIMLEFAEKFFCSHWPTSFRPSRRRRNFRRRR
jgi:hypothetical protein